jgi:hypothetical protein
MVIIYNHMVVGASRARAVDRVFHALADATRRDAVGADIEGEDELRRRARVGELEVPRAQCRDIVCPRIIRGDHQAKHPSSQPDGSAMSTVQ